MAAANRAARGFGQAWFLFLQEILRKYSPIPAGIASNSLFIYKIP